MKLCIYSDTSNFDNKSEKIFFYSEHQTFFVQLSRSVASVILDLFVIHPHNSRKVKRQCGQGDDHQRLEEPDPRVHNVLKRLSVFEEVKQNVFHATDPVREIDQSFGHHRDRTDEDVQDQHHHNLQSRGNIFFTTWL